MDGIKCPKNSSIPFVEPGYGRSLQDLRFAIACIPDEACLWTNYSLETQCGLGYQGEFCSKCEDNYYRSGLLCVPCGVEVLKFVALIFILILLVITLLRLSTFVSKVPSDVRISLAAMQVIALYPTISYSWPKSLSVLMDISSFTNLNIGFSSPERQLLSLWIVVRSMRCRGVEVCCFDFHSDFAGDYVVKTVDLRLKSSQ
eukprot:TRINITY_DN11651_c0_g2_i1.p1 TRINITY_DN11651_c0_g2~~TRINITY_DN11651_c0_g2_i1.p1  ORF type:complete len:201 (-),score=33.12 TRINITY_DN11651_c0_g2_i1:160-762(-)